MANRNPTHIFDQVTDYLVKKGFNRTNAIFTQEIRDLDESGKPRPSADLRSAGRFLKAFTHLEKWVENGLDLHKVGHHPGPCRVLSSQLTRLCSLSYGRSCGLFLFTST